MHGNALAGKFVFVFCLGAALACLSSCSTIRSVLGPDSTPDKTPAVASWYGADFHGRPTASGEIFNMHANTCAHKEYPFGTRLKVTHLANNKTAECTVNDRGPFISGRDIDLSYAVAKEIGVIGPGTSRVFLEVTGRDNTYIRKVRVQGGERKGLFAIQAGAFTDSMNAERLKAALRLKYDNVYIEETVVKGTTFHRVRLGVFRNFGSAYSTAEQLGQEGYQPLIVKSDVRI